MKKIIFALLFFVSFANATNNDDVDNFVDIIKANKVDTFKYLEAVSMLNGYLIGKTMISDDRVSVVRNVLKNIKTFDGSLKKSPNYKLFAIAYEFNRDKKYVYIIQAYIDENGYVLLNGFEVEAKKLSSYFDNKQPYIKLLKEVKPEETKIFSQKPKEREIESNSKINKNLVEYSFADYISYKQTLEVDTKQPCPKNRRNECEVSGQFSHLFRINGETYTLNGIKDVVYEKVLKKYPNGEKKLYVIQNLLISK